MKNPWSELPSISPRVLACDNPVVNAFNRRYKESPQFTLQTQLLPEPFIGNPNSPVYILGLNPGYSPNDDEWHKRSDFQTTILANLNHTPSSYPFYFFDPSLANSPGAGWCHRKFRWFVAQFGDQHVAKRLFCVELFPYHSKKYKAIPKVISPNNLVPSITYSAHLVRRAISQNKAIVAMRAFKPWCKLVPELKTYNNLFRLKSSQNVALSPNNVVGYNRLIDQFDNKS